MKVKFTNSGDIIYAVSIEKESEDDGETYDSSFKTFDAHDYSSIATIETKWVPAYLSFFIRPLPPFPPHFKERNTASAYRDY